MNNDENLVFNEGNSINIETNNPNVTIRRVVMPEEGNSNKDISSGPLGKLLK